MTPNKTSPTLKHWLMAIVAFLAYSFICGMLDGFK